MRVRDAAATALAIAALSSCGGGAPSESSLVFQEQVAQARERAQARGAAEEQSQLLDRAESAGEVSLELMREATHAAVECMVEAGLDARYREDVLNGDMIFPGYVVVTDAEPTDSQMSLIDTCDDSHLTAVQWLYSIQPSWVEQRDAYVLGREAELRECLESAGVATDPDADGIDLARVAFDHLGSGEAGQCLDRAGIDAIG